MATINSQDSRFIENKDSSIEHCLDERNIENQSNDSSDYNIFSRSYAENQAFGNKLREKFYNEVFLNKKDMLIDKDNLLVLFEFKLIMRKLFWNKKQQIFKKVPTGAMKKDSAHDKEDCDDSFADWDEPENEFILDDYSSKQAFRNKIQQMFYESVVLNSQDMLIDKNAIILFEHKLVMRRFSWNQKIQDFEKVPTGASKEYKKLLSSEDALDENEE